jgi:inorganic phosphate transporter, PiT family
MVLWGEPVSFLIGFFLLLALALSLGFEFVNGFHDTANAVATVIYTQTLKPTYAVVWSGCWNLLGVLVSAGTVAYSIVALLPLDLVLNSGTGAGFAMIFALLISAILWNLGTWYLGLPASSSHTLIGSIMGVGVANAALHGRGFLAGINWGKAGEVGAALLLSPLLGFVGAAALLLLLKYLVRRDDLYQAPDKDSKPPLWIRGILMITCTLVSFFHGSNDGQKGMGLMMLILIGLVPGAFALNMAIKADKMQTTAQEVRQLAEVFTPLAQKAAVGRNEAVAELTSFVAKGGSPTDTTYAAIVLESRIIADKLASVRGMDALPRNERATLRTDIYLVDETLGKLVGGRHVGDAKEVAVVDKAKTALDGIVKYIPVWVKVAIAVALGMGTMIGWKRIVVTVGEKIGKSHLTYAQGATAELMAAATIGLADGMGLPVSTTHVLSSGIAGSMAANRSGLQKDTLISILLAWVLTMPVCILLGATLFSMALFLTLNVFGLK